MYTFKIMYTFNQPTNLTNQTCDVKFENTLEISVLWCFVSQPRHSRRSTNLQLLSWIYSFASGKRSVVPPSTGRTTPVIQAASSEARNKTALLTSWGWPNLPRGFIWFCACKNWKHPLHFLWSQHIMSLLLLTYSFILFFRESRP